MNAPFTPPPSLADLGDRIEALTTDRRWPSGLPLEGIEARRDELGQLGWLRPDASAPLVEPALFWQQPQRWLTSGQPPFPRLTVRSGASLHPLRPAKPIGVVYRRHIPWLGGALTFRVVDPEADLATFSLWMNSPRVAEIWEDAGPLEKHRAILADRSADPHMLPLFGEFQGRPFGYFEVYWARENRIGPCYEADDYDRGWHVAIGAEDCRGKPWVSAWLPSLMHFMFLDDPRTRRIVGEPRASHAQQIRNLVRSGFAPVKHFDFPHKRALLVMLWRERFFEDQLWVPHGEDQ